MQRQMWSALFVISAMTASAAGPSLGSHQTASTGHEPLVPKRRLRLRQQKDMTQVQDDRPRLIALDVASHQSDYAKESVGERAVVTVDVATQRLNSALATLQTDAANMRAACVRFRDVCIGQYQGGVARLSSYSSAVSALDDKRFQSIQTQAQLDAEVAQLKKTADANLLSYQEAVEQDHKATTAHDTTKDASQNQAQALDNIVQALTQKRSAITSNSTETLDYIIGIFQGMKTTLVQDMSDRQSDHETESDQMSNLISSLQQSLTDSEDTYSNKRYEKRVADTEVADLTAEKDIRNEVSDEESTVNSKIRYICGGDAGRMQALIAHQDELFGTVRTKIEQAQETVNDLPDLQVPDLLQMGMHPMSYKKSALASSSNAPGPAVTRRTTGQSQQLHAQWNPRHRNALFTHHAGVAQAMISSGRASTSTPCASVKQTYATQLQAAQRQYHEAKIQADLAKAEIQSIDAQEQIARTFLNDGLSSPYQALANEWATFQAGTSQGYRSAAAKSDIDAAISDVNIYLQNGGPNLANLLLQDLSEIKNSIDDMSSGTSSDMLAIKNLVADDLLVLYPNVLNQLSGKVSDLETRQGTLTNQVPALDTATNNAQAEVTRVTNARNAALASCT